MPAKKRKKSNIKIKSRNATPNPESPGALGAERGRNFEKKILYNTLMEHFSALVIPRKTFSDQVVHFVDKKVNLIVVPQFVSSYRLDFLLVNPKNNKRMGLEARFYGGKGGSLKERGGDWCFKAIRSRIPSIMVYSGTGWNNYFQTFDANLKMIKEGSKYVLRRFNHDNDSRSIVTFIKK